MSIKSKVTPTSFYPSTNIYSPSPEEIEQAKKSALFEEKRVGMMMTKEALLEHSFSRMKLNARLIFELKPLIVS